MELDRQISENAARRDEIYETREVSVIRLRDSITEVLPRPLEKDS